MRRARKLPGAGSFRVAERPTAGYIRSGMPTPREQTDLADVHFRLPLYARSELDEWAREDGSNRATLLRSIVMPELRERREKKGAEPNGEVR